MLEWDDFGESFLVPRNHKTLERLKGTAHYRRAFGDIKETPREFIATILLPGIQREDIVISISRHGIGVHGQRHEQKRDAGRGIQLQRSYLGFYRYFSLPKDADLNGIKADFDNDVLQLRIPKIPKQ